MQIACVVISYLGSKLDTGGTSTEAS